MESKKWASKARAWASVSVVETLLIMGAVRAANSDFTFAGNEVSNSRCESESGVSPGCGAVESFEE